MQEEHNNKRLRVRGLAAVFLLLVGLSTTYPLAASAQLTGVDVFSNSYQDRKDFANKLIEKPSEVAWMMVIWNFCNLFLSASLMRPPWQLPPRVMAKSR